MRKAHYRADPSPAGPTQPLVGLSPSPMKGLSGSFDPASAISPDERANRPANPRATPRSLCLGFCWRRLSGKLSPRAPFCPQFGGNFSESLGRGFLGQAPSILSPLWAGARRDKEPAGRNPSPTPNTRDFHPTMGEVPQRRRGAGTLLTARIRTIVAY